MERYESTSIRVDAWWDSKDESKLGSVLYCKALLYSYSKGK